MATLNFVLIWVLFASSTGLYAQESLLEFSQTIGLYDRYELIRSELMRINERGENEAGTERMFNYLIRFAEERGIEWQSYNIVGTGEFHSFGQNISYTIPALGINPMSTNIGVPPPNEARSILFFIPYINTHNRSNIAVISAILALLENPRPLSPIEITFLGSVEDNKGLREFFNRARLLPASIAIYLRSGSEFAQTVYIENGSEGNITPYSLYQFLNEAIVSKNLILEQSQTSQHRLDGLYLSNFFRLFNTSFSSQNGQTNAINRDSEYHLLDLEPNSAEIQFLEGDSINSSLRNSGEDSTRASVANSRAEASVRVLAFLYDLLFLTDNEIVSPDIDTHYLNYIIFNFPIIISEQNYIIILYSVFLAALLLFIVRRTHFKNTIQKHFFHILTVVMHSAAMFVSFICGYYFLQLIARIRNFDITMFHSPIALFFVQCIVSLSIFVLLLLIFRMFNKKIQKTIPNSYTVGVFIIPFVNFIMFSFINISFTHYFVLILLGSWLFLITNRKGLKILLLLFVCIPLFFIFLQILSNDSLVVSVLNLNIPHYLALSLLLLPPTFLILEISPSIKKLYVPIIILPSLIVIVFIASVYIPLYSPESPQEIYITSSSESRVSFFSTVENNDREVDTMSAGLRFESESRSEQDIRFNVVADSYAELGRFNVPFADQELSVNSTQREHSFEPILLERNLNFSASRQAFLNQNRYTINLNNRASRVRRYEIALRIGSNEPIYSSSIPYSFDSSLEGIRFFSGTNPPNPFVFDFAIPEDSLPRLEITAVYANNEPFRFSENEPRVFYFERRETVIFESEVQLAN